MVPPEARDLRYLGIDTDRSLFKLRARAARGWPSAFSFSAVSVTVSIIPEDPMYIFRHAPENSGGKLLIVQ